LRLAIFPLIFDLVINRASSPTLRASYALRSRSRVRCVYATLACWFDTRSRDHRLVWPHPSARPLLYARRFLSPRCEADQFSPWPKHTKEGATAGPCVSRTTAPRRPSPCSRATATARCAAEPTAPAASTSWACLQLPSRSVPDEHTIACTRPTNACFGCPCVRLCA
jgi:hypothetical protein